MKVKPVKMEEISLSHVMVGDIFTFNGKKFIKLAESDNLDCVPAITLLPVEYIDITKNQNESVEQRAVAEYVKFVQSHKHGDIAFCYMPDADMYRKYSAAIKPHMKAYISEAWYVDNGENDSLSAGEFYYIDNIGDLHKATEKKLSTMNFDMLGVIVLYSIEQCAKVFIPY